MINHLRIEDHRAIKQATLSYLGKVNVVCGKNNSGKSTLLEAIYEGAQRSSGCEITPENIKEICKQTTPRPQDVLNFGFREAEAHARVLTQVLEQHRLWFENDLSKFAADVAVAFENHPFLRQFRFNPQAVASIVERRMACSDTFLLIPAKRHLTVLDSTKIGTDEPADTVKLEGAGLISYLFYAKNQPGSSKHRELYDMVSSAFTDISSGYRFELFMATGLEQKAQLYFARGSSNWIEAQQCGLGLQDLLFILFQALRPESV